MTDLKVLLASIRSRSNISDAVRDATRQSYALASQLDLDERRRSENLRILRGYMEGTQQQFAKMLKLGSQSAYSQLECGDSSISDSTARRIEVELELPVGWLDRNNAEMLFISNDEMRLIQEMRRFTTTATSSMIGTLQHLHRVQ